MKTFTKKFMMDNCGCYSQEQLMQCSFMKKDKITLESIFESEIPLKDKYWFYCRKVATKEQNQQIAIAVAEIVLPIWEERYPNDKRPHEAIHAAKQFMSGHIGINELIEKRKVAAYATVVDAVYATVVDAVYATVVDAAAYAAYAAAYAYDAAVDDANTKIKKELEDYLMSFLYN